MDQKEAFEILKSVLEYEFGEEALTDLRVNNSQGVISFQGTISIDPDFYE